MSVLMAQPERPAAERPLFPGLVPHPHSARIIDAVLMGFLVVRTSFPGIPIPAAQLAVMALLLVCLTRRPTRSFAFSWWIPTMMSALLVFLVATSLWHGLDPTRRSANLAVLTLMALFLASGRIDIGSAIKGLGIALVANAALFYARLAPNNYQGRLTGFLEDKNAGALIIAVTMVLLLMVTRRPWMKATVIALGAAAVIATDSRTTMAATGVALSWLLVSRFAGRTFQLVALGVAYFAFLWADANLAEIGDYAVTREGSDDFRSRIDAASGLKAAASPWYGLGLGQAFVRLDSGNWLFHNSYEGLFVEGGIVALVGIVGIYVVAGLGFGAHRATDVLSPESRSIVAANIILFCCALRLGEVFLAPIGFLVLGIGIARLLPTINRQPSATPSQGGTTRRLAGA